MDEAFAVTAGSFEAPSGGAKMFSKRGVKTVVFTAQAIDPLLLLPGATATEKTAPPPSPLDHLSSILWSNKQDQRLLRRLLEDIAEPKDKKVRGAWSQPVLTPSPPGTCFDNVPVSCLSQAGLIVERQRQPPAVPRHQLPACWEFVTMTSS